MSILIENIIALLSRYLHIVCTTLLVGGTLFYEMVVPVAIDELKQEQQLAVFARARWVFRRIVWTAAIVLVLTGVFSTTKHWGEYTRAEDAESARATTQRTSPGSIAWRPGWWWAAHASTGMITVVIAVFLTYSNRPPSHPIGWMRLNLVILLVVIFLGSATRHVRQVSTNTRAAPTINPSSAPVPATTTPTTQPTPPPLSS